VKKYQSTKLEEYGTKQNRSNPSRSNLSNMQPQQLQLRAIESCKLRQKLQLHQYDDSGPVKSLIQNRVSLKN